MVSGQFQKILPTSLLGIEILTGACALAQVSPATQDDKRPGLAAGLPFKGSLLPFQ